MSSINLSKLLVYLGVIVAVTPILGLYMKKVFAREKTLLDPILNPVERLIYRVCGVDAQKDEGWVEWTVVMLVVNGRLLSSSTCSNVCSTSCR
jgi:K+-transporting ATPase ATPase A chain